MVDIDVEIGNKIFTNSRRMVRFISPVGMEDWYTYMKNLTGYQIEWRYSWLTASTALIRSCELYYIELIGLKGLQPYAPIRVLRQFGRNQVIPLRGHMDRSEFEFGTILEIHRVAEILQRWENFLTISIYGFEQAYCTPKYYAWLLVDAEDGGLILPGQTNGFEDVEETIWAHNLLNHHNVTPEMLLQVIPCSVDHLH